LTTSTTPSVDGIDKDPLPLPVRRAKIWAWVTPAISIAILAMIAWHLRTVDFDKLVGAVPTSILFWVVFFGRYFVGIIAEFAIFRWLWHIPFEGFFALTRKNVTNELVVDYLGEAYFYSWARRKMKMVTAPFGAVKDVAILSALVSNLFTLVMMALVYRYAMALNLSTTGTTIAISIGIMLLISVVVLAFSKKIFSLSRAQLWGISGIHLLRLIISNILLAWVWSIALPNVAIGWWLLLATARMLISRLPLISNKDVIFAAVAVFAIGRDEEIQLLIALTTTLTLLMHMAIGLMLAIGDLVTLGPKHTREED
jgi:hypothetical protein